MSQNTNQSTSSSDQSHQQVADWIKDIFVLEGHIEEAMDRQLKIQAPSAEVNNTIQHFHDTVRDSKRRAQQYSEQYGTTATEGLVEKGAELLGVAAGLIDKVRKDTAAKALRDDYTAFNLAAISYTMLHTTALAVQDSATATFAEQGLRTYASLVQKVNEVIPVAVLDDLKSNSNMPVDNDQIVQHCRETIDSVWKQTAQ